MSIRVLVVDDQAMVRAGLRMLLAEEPNIDVIAEAGDGLEALAQAARFQPDVILMDIRMLELDGLEATRRVLAAHPTTKVLVLTTFNLDDYVYHYQALRAGASGFVLNNSHPGPLRPPVRRRAGQRRGPTRPAPRGSLADSPRTGHRDHSPGRRQLAP